MQKRKYIENLKNITLSSLLKYVRWSHVGIAVLSAALLWFCVNALGLIGLIPLLGKRPESVLYFLLAGVLLGLMRLYWLPALVAGIALVLWLAICFFTPLSSSLIVSLRYATPPSSLRPHVADAVVVLGSGIQRDNEFNAVSEARFLGTLKVVRHNWAPLIVLTQSPSPDGSHLKAAQKMLAQLKLKIPMTVVGIVHNTHDEAVAVTKLARQHKWETIILVTSPTHSIRAEMVFRRAGKGIGLKVLSVPCQETAYNIENLSSPDERVEAFSSALHEMMGIAIYRMRGWI
jgi:uncharacterized SAM-binding protein YcdF (DUF218 family)